MDTRNVMRVVILSGLLIGSPLRAADWSHWRGPTRDGVQREPSGWTGSRWLPTAATWSRQVGEGSSSPLVIGNQLFVLGWHDQHDHLTCLEASTGNVKWSVSYKCPQYGRKATGDEGFYSGPTSTPEYDSTTGLLYSLSCDGDLNCWDLNKQGRKLWNVNLYERYQVPQRRKIGRSGLRDYGYTTAPLVHREWVIVEAGAESGTLIAFNKRTGEPVWQSAAKDPAGHAGGLVPISVEGVPCVAAFTLRGLLVTRLDESNAGRTVAEYPWTTEFVNNIATPAVHENSILITSGYNQNAICKLEITLDGAKKVWQQPYSSLVCSPLVHQGRVYWAGHQLYCLDFKTGEKLWEGGRFGDAGSCILTSDDRLIVWGGKGTLALVETASHSPEKYLELARIDHLAADDVWPHVVLAHGRIFCKSRNGVIQCFQTRPPASQP